MAHPALLPRTAPFPEEHIASLDRVLADASPTQRAWLAGFLAGLDAQASDAAAAAQPASPPRAAEPLTILYASESGNAERLALDAGKAARKSGFKPTVVDFADLDATTLAKTKRLLVVAATWGEGEPPSRATRAYTEFMSEGAPRLQGVEFGVLALGDTAYVEFCQIGKTLDARLEELGGKRIVDRLDCDLDFEVPAAEWVKAALAKLAPAAASADNVVALDFGSRATGEVSRDPVTAEVTEHQNLSSSRSDKEVVHVALSFEGAAPAYEPGDSIDVYAENDPELADQVLQAAGLAGDDALRRRLVAERDITTLSMKTLDTFASATGHAGARALLDEQRARAWIEGRQLVDLLEEFPVALSSEQALALTRPLPPRAYSIASSRKEVGEEAHLLVAATRYTTHGRARKGVASTFIADRLKSGASVKVRVKPNRHFRLPDASTDIIMIGPGTGVAPFRAFVQERRAMGAGGRNWLFFGDRHFLHDFAYQLEWQDALEDGSLSRIDVAFSRDQPEKLYVQDRMWEKRRDLVDWIEGGARVYVCGDADHMAKDVRSTLERAYADVKALSPEAAVAAVATLERDKRYLQDVY